MRSAVRSVGPVLGVFSLGLGLPESLPAPLQSSMCPEGPHLHALGGRLPFQPLTTSAIGTTDASDTHGPPMGATSRGPS